MSPTPAARRLSGFAPGLPYQLHLRLRALHPVPNPDLADGHPRNAREATTLQIGGSATEQLRGFARHRKIASTTQEPTDLAGMVVMVDAESAAVAVAFTDSAPVGLGRLQFFKVADRWPWLSGPPAPLAARLPPRKELSHVAFVCHLLPLGLRHAPAGLRRPELVALRLVLHVGVGDVRHLHLPLRELDAGGCAARGRSPAARDA